ncbi:MAG TPA: hypothetical protein VFB63_12805 [Bryobacteraceae bacterium]|nr:hypothetical protein [Bryobacteraceae bacterium]
MSRRILTAAVVTGALAFLAMLAVTVIWMTVPERIVYRESSQVQTPAFSEEVKQHGKSYFVTLEQKKTLDRITVGTPIVWFGSLAVAVLAILVGAGASLRLPTRIE